MGCASRIWSAPELPCFGIGGRRRALPRIRRARTHARRRRGVGGARTVRRGENGVVRRNGTAAVGAQAGSAMTAADCAMHGESARGWGGAACRARRDVGWGLGDANGRAGGGK